MADNCLSFHVGSYARLHGKGLYPVRLAGETWQVGEPFTPAANASFGIHAERFDLHYLVDEADHHVGIYRRASSGWEQVARIETNGAEPCHLALDADEEHIAIANYGSGSVTLFELDPTNGLPIAPEHVHRNGGHGPNDERQESPHAHWVGFAGSILYQTDLGTDQVLAYRMGEGVSLSDPTVAYAAPPGSGPRYIAFHPRLPVAYLVSELASTLTLFDMGDGELVERRRLSTLPPGFSGESLGGHIQLNQAGNRLYVTNRGHDSIAVFALDAEGEPKLLQHVASGGASPRFLKLFEAERRLIVANEEGGNLCAYEIAEDGRLEPFGAPVEVPGAVFVLEV